MRRDELRKFTEMNIDRTAILTVVGAVKNEAEWQTVDQGKRGERAIL